jgi:hypothetical protein
VELANYQGPDLERMKEFIFNKGRFLGASDLTDEVCGVRVQLRRIALRQGPAMEMMPYFFLSTQAFERLETVAEGDGRCVYRVRHRHTDLILAQKIINFDRTQESHAVLQNELRLLHECHSPEIINFFGSYISGSNVNVVMEWMVGNGQPGRGVGVGMHACD